MLIWNANNYVCYTCSIGFCGITNKAKNEPKHLNSKKSQVAPSDAIVKQLLEADFSTWLHKRSYCGWRASVRQATNLLSFWKKSQSFICRDRRPLSKVNRQCKITKQVLMMEWVDTNQTSKGTWINQWEEKYADLIHMSYLPSTAFK